MIQRPSRSAALLLGGLAVGLMVVPVLGAAPSASPGAAPSAEPSRGPVVGPVAPGPSADVRPDASGPPIVPPGQAKPDKAAKPDKVAKPDKAAKPPEIDVTVSGTVRQTTDAKGDVTFSLVAGGTTWTLSAGPGWWWGDANPLAEVVGDAVTIGGEHREGSTQLDVQTIDGTAIRAAGKPPWAGGWKVVGERHPGWAAWKAERFQ